MRAFQLKITACLAAGILVVLAWIAVTAVFRAPAWLQVVTLLLALVLAIAALSGATRQSRHVYSLGSVARSALAVLLAVVLASVLVGVVGLVAGVLVFLSGEEVWGEAVSLLVAAVTVATLVAGAVESTRSRRIWMVVMHTVAAAMLAVVALPAATSVGWTWLSRVLEVDSGQLVAAVFLVLYLPWALAVSNALVDRATEEAPSRSG